MCGIAGYILPIEHSKGDISACLLEIESRGPDNSNVYTETIRNYNLDFLATRFAIIDLNKRSNQPFWDISGNLGIIFNGEIFNHQQLRKELVQSGYRIQTQSDTEILLYAYDHWFSGRGVIWWISPGFLFFIFRRLDKVWP